jgi:hypothetical protein
MILTRAIAGQDYDAGFIGFCKTTRPGLMGKLSDMITWFETQDENDDFQQALGESKPDAPSHVIICISKTEIIEAYVGGVQINPISKYLGNPDIQVVFREPLDMLPVDVDYIVKGAESILGRPYNYPGLLGRALAMVLHLDKWAWYNKQPLLIRKIYETYYCSAAGSHALKNDPKYLICKLFQEMDESKITPAQLYGRGPFHPLHFSRPKEGLRMVRSVDEAGMIGYNSKGV